MLGLEIFGLKLPVGRDAFLLLPEGGGVKARADGGGRDLGGCDVALEVVLEQRRLPEAAGVLDLIVPFGRAAGRERIDQVADMERAVEKGR